MLRLYEAGERDFRGTILRGCNVRRADLSGADFSGADIRSARFVEATLRGATFCHAQAGLQRRWLGLLVPGIVAFVLTGFCLVISGASTVSALFASELSFVGIGIMGVIIFAAFFYVTLRRGTYEQGAKHIALILGGTVAVAIIIFVNTGGTFTFASAGSVVGAITSLSLYVYINYRNYRRRSVFEKISGNHLNVIKRFGTSFSGADLTEATFAYACLKSTSFVDSHQRPTMLTRVRWRHAQKLEYADLRTYALSDRRVCILLTTLDGIDQDLSNIDLQGANLADAKLFRTNLKGANLSGANLSGAELQGANLTQAQCVGTDFTGSHLTGVCLESWITHETTILSKIDCQYVFLKEIPNEFGWCDRLPHDPKQSFEPGDFEKFFKEMPDTVQILIRNGINPDSFKAVLRDLVSNYPSINADSLQSFDRKGNDLLVKLQVPEGIDKSEIKRFWNHEDVCTARLQTEIVRAQLEAEKRRADDVKEVALGFSKFLSSIQINNMNNPISTGDGSFYAGGEVNLTGSTLNLGKISGQVSNQINQLPDGAPESDKPSLKDLLTQLQAAIEADKELSDIEKKEAFGEVAKLAEAGNTPKENAMQRMAKRAADNLKSIAEPLTEASNLAEACKNLLPLILPLFALL
ncbi:pentapeptide repeat-containing protein [Vacuolonema iberomarrocanum]|uniref:pentapeptide repeat-containing protein n=1 Tax=Vacuolonema iberomarrocanum TaxID=3454632 RepID=UPI0019F86336|nr:pentapeptide repeat-containing protein [filamentous cyanobacterium LEGE 07170]